MNKETKEIFFDYRQEIHPGQKVCLRERRGNKSISFENKKINLQEVKIFKLPIILVFAFPLFKVFIPG